MGEEKAISYDHRGEEPIAWSTRWAKKQESVLKPCPLNTGEEVIAWSIRWAKKKPFPVTIDVKNQWPGVPDGRLNRNLS
jgi:hypothetical protein